MATHAEADTFRCDGGFCQDGRHYTLDCRMETCRGPARGFPTITHPYFDEGDWLKDDDRVIGMVIQGDARAYPIRILNFFETVNDTVGGEPVIVTYCPLCGSGIVYSRIVDGETLTFYNTGAIWRSDLVMYDLETKSWWTQIGGNALTGPMHGTDLTIVKSQHVTWKEWKDAHPGTKVLARPVGQDWEPLAPYGRDIGYTDLAGSLNSYSRVTGVVLENGTVAFPVFKVKEEGVVQTTHAGVRLVAAYAAEEAQVYRAGDRDFTAGETEGTFVDDRGVVYDALTGKGDDGTRLERVPVRTTYWFAWRDFHKDTMVWLGEEDGKDDGGDGLVPGEDVRGSPATPSLALLLALVAVSCAMRRRR